MVVVLYLFVWFFDWYLFPLSLHWKLCERRKPYLLLDYHCIPTESVVNKYVLNEWMVFFFFFCWGSEDSNKHTVFENCCSSCCGFHLWIKSKRQTVVNLDSITLFPHVIAFPHSNWSSMPLVQTGACCKLWTVYVGCMDSIEDSVHCLRYCPLYQKVLPLWRLRGEISLRSYSQKKNVLLLSN